MLLRKVWAAFYTSILTIAGFNIVYPFHSADGGLVSGILIYSIYVVPIIFIYGIISSLISDGIGRKVKKYKESVSFFLHVLFGLGFILPYGLFFEYDPIPELNFVNVISHTVTILGALCAILFFVIDYILRRWNSRRKKYH